MNQRINESNQPNHSNQWNQTIVNHNTSINSVRSIEWTKHQPIENIIKHLKNKQQNIKSIKSNPSNESFPLTISPSGHPSSSSTLIQHSYHRVIENGPMSDLNMVSCPNMPKEGLLVHWLCRTLPGSSTPVFWGAVLSAVGLFCYNVRTRPPGLPYPRCLQKHIIWWNDACITFAIRR